VGGGTGGGRHGVAVGAFSFLFYFLFLLDLLNIFLLPSKSTKLGIPLVVEETLAGVTILEDVFERKRREKSLLSLFKPTLLWIR